MDTRPEILIDWEGYLCKHPPVLQNPWMSDLHRPLKQVNNICLIARHLLFLCFREEVCLLAKGRASPSGLHQPQFIQTSASTQGLLSQWLMTRQS